MNLEESNRFLEEQEQREKKKKIVLVSIVLCGILAALLLVMIIYIQYEDSLQLKMYVDGTQVDIANNLLYQKDDITYVNVKTFAEKLGYTYTKGEYQKYNENINSCYIRNDVEVVAMTVGSKTLTKYIDVRENSNIFTPEGPYGSEIRVESENGESNIFVLKQPLILVENQIYMPFDLVTDVFNVAVNTSEQNRIRMYTLPFLFKNAVQIAAQLGYTNIDGTYENIRAIPYGLIIVGNNGVYGAIDSSNGQQVLSIKYENMEFIQNVQEFLIKGANTVGLLSKTGDTIIQPTEYDEMEILDELEQLYLVKKDSKYGVLNRKGEILIHIDYDRIGLRKIEEFKIDDMRNPQLIHDKCIVVELDSLYGLFNIEGEELLKPVYEQFGYLKSSTDVSGEDSVLLIPAELGIKGIIVQFNDLYGIYDVNKEDWTIPTSCSRIYSITKAGKTTYYMEYANEQIELENYLESYNLKSIIEKEETDESEDIVIEDTQTNPETTN